MDIKKMIEDAYTKAMNEPTAENLANYDNLCKLQNIHDAQEKPNDKVEDKVEVNDEVKVWVKKVCDAIAVGSSYTGLVPVDIANRIQMKMDKFGQLRKYVSLHRPSGSYKFAVEAGAATVSWEGEADPLAETTPTATVVSLDAYACACLVKLSKEVIADPVVDFVEYVSTAIAKAMAKEEDKVIIKGAGSTQPTGIVTALAAEASTPQVVTGTGGTTTTIAFTWAELKAVLGKVRGYKGANSIIVCNSTTLDHIHGLKDGANHFIFDQTKDLNEIWGMPIVVCEDMDDAYKQASTGADAYPVVAGNFEFYHLAERQETKIQVLQELYAANRQVGIIGDKRIDGKPGINAAFAALKIAKAS